MQARKVRQLTFNYHSRN